MRRVLLVTQGLADTVFRGGQVDKVRPFLLGRNEKASRPSTRLPDHHRGE